MESAPYLSRRFACAALCVMLGVLARPAAAADAAPKTEPGARTGGAAPIYVGAYSVDHEFHIVTKACMDIIRGKRILFGSRSWGLGLGVTMGAKDKTYAVEWDSHSRERVTEAERVLKPDAFDQPKIVHYVFDMVPRRWTFMDDFLRKEPWVFGPKIDGCFQSLYCGPEQEAKQMADEYFPLLDKMIADFTNIIFAVFTHPVSADGMDLRGNLKEPNSPWNIGGGEYSDKLVRTYYGKVAIFDIRDIVSTHPDGNPCTFEYKGKTYRKLCPEYNSNKDLIHPNTPEARERVAKGFLILLTKMFCAGEMPPLDTPKPDILK